MKNFSKTWVKDYGDELFRFAFYKVNDKLVAEDIVQDTFVAALKGYDNFNHNSSEKSWMFSIIRNKIVDHYRSKGRNLTDNYENENVIDSLFTENGHYKKPVCQWKKSPEEALHDREFRKVLELCIEHLPPKQKDVFAFRDIDGLSGEDICKVLNLSSSNLWVLTHRARVALRNCLTINWFGEEQ